MQHGESCQTLTVFSMEGRVYLEACNPLVTYDDALSLKLYGFESSTLLRIIRMREQTWGPFLESPGNFSGPKSNIPIEI